MAAFDARRNRTLVGDTPASVWAANGPGARSPISSPAATSPVSQSEIGRVSYYNSLVQIHPSARKHVIADEDIEHAVENAMSIDERDDDTRLYLGPARDADLLGVVTIVKDYGSELGIHAMRMRPRDLPLLGGD